MTKHHIECTIDEMHEIVGATEMNMETRQPEELRGGFDKGTGEQPPPEYSLRQWQNLTDKERMCAIIRLFERLEILDCLKKK